MLNRAELKQLAKSQLSGKWGSGVLITFVYGIINFGINIIVCVPFLVSIPVNVGLHNAYLNFVKTNKKLEVSDLFNSFNYYGKALGIVLWTALWTVLWSLLFIIPGIIKSLAYSQSVYIVANNPNVNVLDALKISMKMTKGYKWQIFIMGLSFLGWIFLGVLSLFIGFLWIVPYIKTTFANLFFKLKQLSIENGVCTEEEFNGMPPVSSTPPVEPSPTI